jgi:hypothetical protein
LNIIGFPVVWIFLAGMSLLCVKFLFSICAVYQISYNNKVKIELLSVQTLVIHLTLKLVGEPCIYRMLIRGCLLYSLSKILNGQETEHVATWFFWKYLLYQTKIMLNICVILIARTILWLFTWWYYWAMQQVYWLFPSSCLYLLGR